MKNLLYVAFAVFFVAVIVAALLLFAPKNIESGLDNYEDVGRGSTERVEAPEYVVGDEFRKESISDF